MDVAIVTSTLSSSMSSTVPSAARAALRRFLRRAQLPTHARSGPLALGVDAVDPVLPDRDTPVTSRARPRRRLHAAAAASGLLMLAADLPTAPEPEGPEGDDPAEGDDDLAPATLAAETRLLALGEAWAERTDDDTEQEQEGPLPLARVGDIDLWVPDGVPVVVGFHEAGGPSPLPMEPATKLDVDLHPDPVVPTEDADHVGHAAMVLPSRGRGSHPASAVDVVLEPGSTVLAPVDGEVVGVSQYPLYGHTTDWVIQIRPAQDRSKLVEVFHVAGPSVEVGDRLIAGVTPIADEVRALPFASQIDPFAAEQDHEVHARHVHIEVQHA